MNNLNADKNRRVLVIDDNRAIHDDFRKILCPATATAKALDATEVALFGGSKAAVEQTEFEVDSAYQGEEGVLLSEKAIEAGRPYAMAFVDVRMPPGWDGVETTTRLWQLDPNLQVVLCTAYSDYSWGEMFEALGQRDGLLILKKPFDSVEAFQLAHALTEKWWLHQQSRRKLEELEGLVAGRTRELQQTNRALQREVVEHTRAAEALQALSSRQEAILAAIPDMITEVNSNKVYTWANQAGVEFFGEDVIGKEAAFYFEGEQETYHNIQSLFTGNEQTTYVESWQRRRDGKKRLLGWWCRVLKDRLGIVTGVLSTGRDITERKRIEAQLLQSQKMEMVGKLAGGVAHEFNSILTAIIGQSEILLNDLPPHSPLVTNTTEIAKAANRAAGLTRQLLAYGRKQILKPEILDLNQIIIQMDTVLRHLLGQQVDIQIRADADIGTVRADAGQIDQVIMNMVLNARDAMPDGGKLTLETANMELEPNDAERFPDLRPGAYVMLLITDSGIGMNKDTLRRVFEPFFTTKPIGEGTGLGLSTGYGIIKQSGGHISVYSEPSRGTTFKVYLPQVQREATISPPQVDALELPRGTETILLVEDDPALREMATMLLRRLGYTVYAASSGIEAISLKRKRGTGPIDLLFTDVAMPHMSGKELAERMQARYPLTRILFTSAFSENAIVHQGLLKEGVALLQKPFTPSSLARKIREVLDADDPD